MPRKQRKPSEIAEVKRKILKNAVMLMNKAGFEGFTMRGLARTMNVTAPTIYSYYENKDELYLVVLTKGFQMLFNKIKRACRSHEDPFDKLRILIEAYMDFGLKKANFYNLMFTWHVPKYNDYIGTPLQNAAHNELTTAMQVTDFSLDIIKKCAGGQDHISDEDARFYLLYFWSTLHGYVAGINNTLVDYMHEAPLSVKKRSLDLMIKTFQRELESWKPKTKRAG